ncbi:unnamed protein product [Didymodactylos carnosus]|uniref:Alpha-methylacyl-CoA racemase n=1 Tax=Didymodactylos carnosus TaxID=1234261 RepID=A0A8S2G5H7_9BILA|nr:unnamed protein product [Didymodactylos carnosus]CAF4466593.1 unnamed protein product [Didymodactylos carnosus]
MALRGLKVLELSGLAPGPFCGMLLSDFGANVIRIDRSNDQNIAKLDRLSRGKRSISIDLKVPSGIDIFRRLSKSADVLIGTNTVVKTKSNQIITQKNGTYDR